jgi:hypothetical protein
MVVTRARTNILALVWADLARRVLELADEVSLAWCDVADLLRLQGRRVRALQAASAAPRVQRAAPAFVPVRRVVPARAVGEVRYYFVSRCPEARDLEGLYACSWGEICHRLPGANAFPNLVKRYASADEAETQWRSDRPKTPIQWR